MLLVWAEKASINLSIKQEIERSLDMGLKWLSQEQNGSSGNWGLDEYPALTGLAIRSSSGIHPIKLLRGMKNLFRRESILFAQKSNQMEEFMEKG